MTSNPIAPPRKSKKKTKSPSFSSIPDDVIVNVLARISRFHYPSLCLVSKNFYSLLSSPDIHAARSLIGNTDARLYVRIWLPTPSTHHSWFTLGYRHGQLSLVPPPPSDDEDDYVNSYHNGVVFRGRLYFFTMNNNNEKYAYDPKEERWVQEAGFVGLERITGPLCVIGSVIFAEHDGIFKWYDPRNGMWLVVYGLRSNMYTKRANNYRTIQLVNHGGKLVILWEEWKMRQREHKSVWCAVISFEKRLTPSSNMVGKVEWCSVVLGSVHKSYKLSSCLSVLV
ncbi:hypothetical protein Bca4012_022134 [Brassica carinata]